MDSRESSAAVIVHQASCRSFLAWWVLAEDAHGVLASLWLTATTAQERYLDANQDKHDALRQLADSLRTKAGIPWRTAVMGEQRFEFVRGKDFVRFFEKNEDKLQPYVSKGVWLERACVTDLSCLTAPPVQLRPRRSRSSSSATSSCGGSSSTRASASSRRSPTASGPSSGPGR